MKKNTLNSGPVRSMKYFAAATTMLIPSLGCTASGVASEKDPNDTSDQLPTGRPNIVLIITDEHNANVMGCMGDPYVSTPNLDALAASGILVDGHYCASPISGPSRQSLTTGRYVSHHNVWGNTIGCPNDTPSLPRIMQDAGYDAVLAGGMKYKGMNYGFSTFSMQKNKLVPAIDKSMPEGSTTPRARTRDVQAGVFTDNDGAIGSEFESVGATDMSAHVDVARTENALAFLKSRKADDKPFFLLVGLISPHYPLQSTPELITKYKGSIPMPEIPDGYLESLPLNYKHLRNVRKFDNLPDDLIQECRDSYYALVEWSDRQVGAIVDAVRFSDYSSNTIIIYTSDHGENMGEHGLWWKNCLYDSSAKVPLIFSYPERWAAEGQRRTEASSSVDLVKTIAELGEARVPANWDGQSMLSWLDDPEHTTWCNRAVTQYYSGYIASGITMYRQGEWKYVYHTRADEAHGPVIELYNLRNDPKELVNLANDPANADLIRTLHAALVEETGEDPEQTEARYRAGAIPTAPLGIYQNR